MVMMFNWDQSSPEKPDCAPLLVVSLPPSLQISSSHDGADPLVCPCVCVCVAYGRPARALIWCFDLSEPSEPTQYRCERSGTTTYTHTHTHTCSHTVTSHSAPLCLWTDGASARSRCLNRIFRLVRRSVIKFKEHNKTGLYGGPQCVSVL